MIDPATITTSGIKVLKVLHNDGPDGYSVARIKDARGVTYLGMRWNGSDDENEKGYPTSRGFPVFFSVPAELEPVLSGFYRENPRTLARALSQ